MERKNKKRLFKIVIFFLILIFIYYPGYRKIKELSRERRQICNKIEEIEKENKLLEEKLYKLENDADYIEKRAREKLGLLGKGEILYRFVPSEETK
jgi:cell division protein FtsB